MSIASSKPPKLSETPSTQSSSVPWNSWLAIVFVIVVFYAAQYISSFFVSLYTLSKHWSHSEAIHWLNNSVNAQFIYVLLAEVLTLVAIFLFLRMYKMGFAGIGLKRPRWIDPIYGLAAVPVYFFLFILIVALVRLFAPDLDIRQKQQIGFHDVTGTSQLILTFLSVVVLPAVTEEVMVRGFLYSSLKKVLPIAGAVITTSLIFAAAHLSEGGPSGPLYIAALDTFALSLVLIYLREKTGSLWASITLHAIKNSIAFIYLFVLHIR